MNLFENFKLNIIEFFEKFINRKKVLRFPVFYINGSQTLPPPLDSLEEEEILKKVENNDDDAKKILEVEIPEGDYDTLSGYLIENLGRIPEDSEKPVIETEKVTYKIEEYEDKRIVKVKACKNKQVDIVEDN